MANSNSTMYPMYSGPQDISFTGSSRPTFASPLGGPTLTTHSDPYRNGQNDMVRDLIFINWILAGTYILARILGNIHTTATLLVHLDPIHYPYILRSLPRTLCHLIYPYLPLTSSHIETKNYNSLPMVIKVHLRSLSWVNAKQQTFQTHQEL